MLQSQYLSDTRMQLMQPAATTALYSDTSLKRFVNIARRQLAAESLCVRSYAPMPTVQNQQVYLYSTIVVPNAATLGIGTVIHARQAGVVVGAGQAYLKARAFEYFNLFFLNQINPATGRPTDWAQYGQGSNGSAYLYPIPDDVYTVNFDTICLPVDLVDDSTPDAIADIWTDAVPYYAAYMALMSAQRIQDANQKLQLYNEFVRRGRQAANPSELQHLYLQHQDVALQNRLAVKPPSQGGGG